MNNMTKIIFKNASISKDGRHFFFSVLNEGNRILIGKYIISYSSEQNGYLLLTKDFSDFRIIEDEDSLLREVISIDTYSLLDKDLSDEDDEIGGLVWSNEDIHDSFLLFFDKKGVVGVIDSGEISEDEKEDRTLMFGVHTNIGVYNAQSLVDFHNERVQLYTEDKGLYDFMREQAFKKGRHFGVDSSVFDENSDRDASSGKKVKLKM